MKQVTLNLNAGGTADIYIGWPDPEERAQLMTEGYDVGILFERDLDDRPRVVWAQLSDAVQVRQTVLAMVR